MRHRYLFESGQRDLIDETLQVEQFWRLLKARKASGQPISTQYSPSNLLQHPLGGFSLSNGDHVFPVAPGVANVPTIMCREGARPFAEYMEDERLPWRSRARGRRLASAGTRSRIVPTNWTSSYRRCVPVESAAAAVRRQTGEGARQSERTARISFRP
jgi:hypothetical protein